MATSTLGSGTLVLAGTTSGTTTVTATAVAGTTTLTLPAATDTLVGKATTDTLTNKTLTGAAMNGTLGATTPSTVAATSISASTTLGVTGVSTLTGGAVIEGMTVGKGAGAVATNTAVGASALAANSTGAYTTAIGNLALNANTASHNVGVGYGAMLLNTTGIANTAVGTGVYGTSASAMQSNTSGSYNSAYGNGALASNTTASNNTAVGYQAGYTNVTGEFCTFIGQSAGYASTGSGNCFVGRRAGVASTGTNNTFIGGINSGSDMTTGSKNTIVGVYSGNQGGLDIRTSSNYIVLSDGDGNPRGIFDNSGNLLIGKTALSATTVGCQLTANGEVYSTSSASTSASNSYLLYSTGASAFRFYVGLNGQINATSTSITGISDVRLKENIRDLDDGLTSVMALKPRKFDWKEGKGADIKNARGFIAQEFETVFPDMIEQWLDPAPEGEEPYKAVNANLIPTLVKAIQELKAEVDSLKAQINGASA